MPRDPRPRAEPGGTRDPDVPVCLELLTRLNVGGPARLVRSLVEAGPADLALRVAAGEVPSDEAEHPMPDHLVTHVPLARSVRPAYDLRALLALRRLLVASGSRPPDLLHTHMAKAGALGRLAALSVRPRPSLVHTYHGHVLTGYFPHWQERAFLEAERALGRRTDALVAVSDRVRDELVDLGVGREARWSVILPGIELEPFLAVPPPEVPRTEPGPLRRSAGLDAQVPLVGSIGRLAPVKDHMTLLGAFAEVPGAHLALVGDGELRDQLFAEARRLGLAERVHFAGWVDDVPGVLADLDVVALSSRNEGTPLVLMEAAAAARPVVATAVGGVPDVVDDGRTGLLVPPGSPHLFAQALRRLLDQPGRRVELGATARERARERFSSERMVTETAALYRSLLARRRPPRT